MEFFIVSIWFYNQAILIIIKFKKNNNEEIEDIMNRRVAEQADKPKKDYLPELNVDNIIALVSSNEGVKFREMFLLRNI